MKKNFILILVLLMCFFNLPAYAETYTNGIRFNDIQWLSDNETTIAQLKDKGFLNNDCKPFVYDNENSVYLIEDETGFVWPMMAEKYKEVCLSTTLKGNVKGKIAGFPVKNLILVFAYDGEYHLISVKAELIGANYTAIKEKIMKAYDSAEERVDEEGIASLTCKGSDNTCILLYAENSEKAFELIYGRLDAAEILSNCLLIDPDDVSGL